MSGVPPNPASALAPCSPSPSPRAHAELLSEDTRAVWSPRLSPDCCRIVYLENDALGPHQQCSRLRMVSGTRGHWGGGGAPMPGQGLAGGWWCRLPGLQWGWAGWYPAKLAPCPVSCSTTGTPSTPARCWRPCRGRRGVSTALGVVRRGARGGAEHRRSHCRHLPGHLLQRSAGAVLGGRQPQAHAGYGPAQPAGEGCCAGTAGGHAGGPGWARAPLDCPLMPLGRVCGGHGDGCHNLADSR